MRSTGPTLGTAEGIEAGGTSRAGGRAAAGGQTAGDGITDTAFGAATLELGRASVELGRAYRALERVMAAVLVALRAVAVLLTLLYLVVWHWYAGQPLATAVVVLSVGWSVFFCVVGLRRGVGRPLAAASVAVALALSLTAERWLPPESVGDSGNFVFLTAVNAAIVAVWAFPPVVAAPGVLLLGAGTLTGGWGHNPQVVVQSAILVLAPGLLGLAIGRLRQIARAADRRWANVVARHRGEAVVHAVARDRRERERIIHDTVLNTLTGIAWGGGRDVALARRRCAQSLAAVQGLLDPDEASGPALDERLAEIVRNATGPRLRVTFDNHLRGAARGAGFTEPPAIVVAAFAGAVGEALANVERHAGTRRARVRMDGGPGVITVRVSDAGRGFDPRRVDPARLGVRRSIVGRLEDVAGTVDIVSAPGRGTTVQLQWRLPRAAIPTGGGGAGGARDGLLAGRRGAAAVAADRRGIAVVADRRGVTAIAADLGVAYAAGLRRAVGQITGLWLVVMLVPLVATLGWVRSRPVAALLWMVLALVIVETARRVRDRPLGRAESLVLLAVALAVTVIGAANTRGPDIVRIADWPLLVLPLLLAFVTASRPRWEWIAALVVAILLLTGLVLARDADNPLVLARLSSNIYGVCSVQIVTAMLGPLLRATAEATARTLAAEAEVAARIDASLMIRRERVQWLGTVEADVLPLLAGIADGRLDPRAAAVRSRCAVRAAAIRRMLTGGGPSSALADLDPVLADAESAGISVEIQLSGDLRSAPAPVRAALADRVGAVLAAAPGGRAIVTVLWAPAGGSVFVALPWPDGVAPPWPEGGDTAGFGVGVPEVGIGVELDDQRLSLELTWPPSTPASAVVRTGAVGSDTR
ncbi:ATP-binding protein [Frankia sp. QA3]|uniref:ATP-binding protein n=1 Tax=Frankia sp. QA3 TaxID=710111 RepID=UPI000269CD21|nr:ATP-binding protein [Frankia sp. QA3]EIV96091.1 signal transduction histidine kinase [Frankia sp. QA3]